MIREDYVAHGRDWTKPGFRAMAVYRFGVWQARLRFRPWRGAVGVFYRVLFRHVRNHYGIELPNSATVGRRVIIEHQHGIVIHGNAQIGDDSHVRQGVTIGNRFLNDPFSAPKLGARVNIGAGAKLLGGITIGDDVNIGANAVVLRDVPAGLTVVGIPAKPVNSGRSGGAREGPEFAELGTTANRSAEGAEARRNEPGQTGGKVLS